MVSGSGRCVQSLHSSKFMCFTYVLVNNSQSKKLRWAENFGFENEGILGTLQLKEKVQIYHFE
jgi:hypothetical protein